MHVNNEIGTITDIRAIGEITHARGIAFHVDAVQSAARLSSDMRSIQADLVSLSGHKMYGPKGVGVLYVRHCTGVRIEPQMHGGNQEQGIRSGTLATHQVVGMGKAAQLMCERRKGDVEFVVVLERRLLDHFSDIEYAFINGNQTYRAAGIVSVGFSCVESESLMMSLEDVAISSGSACTSSHVESSHVLRGLGLSEDLASCSVRFSSVASQPKLKSTLPQRVFGNPSIRCANYLPNGDRSAKAVATPGVSLAVAGERWRHERERPIQ